MSRSKWSQLNTYLTRNPTLFRSGSGDESYSRGQWDTALSATPQSPKGDDS